MLLLVRVKVEKTEYNAGDFWTEVPQIKMGKFIAVLCGREDVLIFCFTFFS